jgi:hypothetical protein
VGAIEMGQKAKGVGKWIYFNFFLSLQPL